MLTTKTNLNQLIFLMMLLFGLTACGSDDDPVNTPLPSSTEPICGLPGSEALAVAIDNYGSVFDSLSAQNTEFTSRAGSFDTIYNIGQFLENGNFNRQIEVNEIDPTHIEGSLLSANFTTKFMSSAEKTQELDGSALKQLLALPLGFSFANKKETEMQSETFVKFEVQFEDVVFRQIDNTEEVIERNINNAPNANQFVYGVYEAKITNKLSIVDNCNKSFNASTDADIEFFSTQMSNATVLKGTNENEIIIKSDVQVPVGYLIRAITSPIFKPHNINATVTEGPNITLRWDLIDPDYNYRVYYSINSNFEIGDDHVETVDVQSPEFALRQGLTKGQTWYFKITSVSGGSASVPSARVAVTIPVDTPKSSLVLEASPRSDGTIRLQWGSPAKNDAIEYTIFRRSTGSTNFIEIATVNPDSTLFIKRDFIDSNLELNTTYIYKISYSNLLSPPASPLSAEAEATTIGVVITDNFPPDADAGQNIEANYGATVTLDGGGSVDDNNEIISYSWQAKDGNPVDVNILNSNKPQATFVAPPSSEATLQLTFTLTVSDGISEDSDTVIVILTPQATPGGGNQPPEAVITASIETPKVGETVTLNGLDSSDGDDQTLSYKWNQIDSNTVLGINELTDAQVSFAIPDGVAAGTIFDLLLEVSDGFSVDTAIVNLTVTEDPAIQGDVEVYIESSYNPVGQNEQVILVITVANNSGVDKTGVTLTMDYPEGFARLSDSYISDGGSCGSYCEPGPGEQVTWSLGTLAAGSSTFVTLSPVAASNINNDTVIPINVSTTDDSAVITTGNYSLKGANKRELNLQLVETDSPVITGGIFSYQLAYGFSGGSAVAEEVALTFTVPEHTSFVSADNGGSFSGGVVIWSLGRFEPEEIGVVNVELQLLDDVAVGTIIAAQAQLADNGSRVSKAETYTKVEQTEGLNLVMSVYPQPAQADEQIYITLTASNTSNTDYDNMNIFLRYAQGLKDLSHSYISDGGSCSGYTCDSSGEYLSWDMGTIKANSATTVTFTPYINSDMADGSILKFYAELEQTDSTLVLAKGNLDIAVAERELELAVDVDHNPIRPGEQLTYTLNYSFNATSVVSNGTMLTLSLPDNTSFVSASHGGTLTENDVVWPLTRLDPGESGKVELVVKLDSSAAVGSTLVTHVQIADNNTPNARRTTNKVVTEVEAARPLELTVVASPDPVRSAEKVNIELIINNTSDFKRSDILLTMRYPTEFQKMYYDVYVSDSGGCSGDYCDDGEFLLWNIGEIGPNSTKTVSLTPLVHENLQPGTMVELYAELEQGANYSVNASASITIKNDRNIELVTTEDKDPVISGELLTYTLTYATYETGAPLTSAMLEASLPAGVEYVASSNNGVFANNKVSWALGSIGAGDSGKQSLTVRVTDTLNPGSTLKLESIFKEADADPAVASRTEIVTRVEVARPLELTITATPVVVQPGSEMNVSLTVNNTADFERSNVWIRLRYPSEWERISSSLISDSGSCVTYGSYCQYDGEFVWWDIGNLPANSVKAVNLQPTVFDTITKGMLLELNAQTSDSSGTITHGHKTIPIK